MKLRAAVFASGGGSNFQALVDHQFPNGAWEIVLLVTDRPDAGAVARARAAGVDVAVVASGGRDPTDVAREVLDALARHGVDLVLLAGYLKLVPREVVERYRGRMLNIHPALLPKFGGKGMYGMNVHRAVLAAGEEESGATVHWVDEEYDSGAVVAQERVPVLDGDTPEALAARVLAVEHRLYPEAVDRVCETILAGAERIGASTPTPTTERTEREEPR